jgi:hypothetical protein
LRTSHTCGIGGPGFQGNAINLAYILWIDGLTYIIVFVAFLSLSYHRSEELEHPRFNIFSGIVDGFLYLKTKPVLILFLLASHMPFISVMVGNYLFPVYILKTLKAGPAVLGAHETIYAVGAVLAGLSIPLLLHRLRTYRTVILTVATYTLSIALAAFIPVVGLFLASTVLMGSGNAGTRVGRNSHLMNVEPTAIFGRVNSFFSACSYAMRLLLIGSFASIINRVRPSSMLMFTGVLLIAAFIGVVASRALFAPETAPPFAGRSSEPVGRA